MRKLLAACLITALIMSVIAAGAIAAPETIKKETVELKADTILLGEKGIPGSLEKSKKVDSYTIKYLDTQTGNASSPDKLYPKAHSRQLAGDVVWKVDISSVKQVSDVCLRFSFETGLANVGVAVYCASFSDGEALTAGLTYGGSKIVTDKPDISTVYPEKLVYEYNSATQAESITAELSAESSSDANPKLNGAVLKNHIADAIKNKQKFVYFIVRGVINNDSSLRTNTNAFFKVYNSASADKAPTLAVTESAVASEVVPTETGYTVKVSGLKNYTDKVLVAVTAFDSLDSLMQISASGQTALTDTPVDVDVPCKAATKLRLYIWKAGTLEPITYPETIVIE